MIKAGRFSTVPTCSGNRWKLAHTPRGTGPLGTLGGMGGKNIVYEKIILRELIGSRNTRCRGELGTDG